jgi:hypothetical protein
MSNLYRGPSIDASYQVSVHLAKIAHFVPIRLETWPSQAILVSDWLISKKSFPLNAHGQFWFIWPCAFRGKDFLEINQSKTRIACGDHVC